MLKLPAMFELMVEETFDAAHALRGYQGPCENLHGHSWKVQATLLGEALNDIGIVIDFKEIKVKLKKTLEQFDHQNLNALEMFKEQNPSCENLSRIIFKNLEKEVPKLIKVTVWESPASCCTYYE
jgi:6-pyruvoyltetrahydropterin/6-carboxytetrahydropterin synthase